MNSLDSNLVVFAKSCCMTNASQAFGGLTLAQPNSRVLEYHIKLEALAMTPEDKRPNWSNSNHELSLVESAHQSRITGACPMKSDTHPQIHHRSELPFTAD